MIKSKYTLIILQIVGSVLAIKGAINSYNGLIKNIEFVNTEDSWKFHSSLASFVFFTSMIIALLFFILIKKSVEYYGRKYFKPKTL